MNEESKKAYYNHHRTMIPKTALIMYEMSESIFSSSNSYFEMSAFEKINRGYRLLPGRPITKEAANNLANALSSSGRNSNLRPMPGTTIPKNVLSYSSGTNPQVSWIVKEQNLPCSFDPALKIPANKMRYPNLLFAVRNRELFVYAIMSEEAKLTDRLYVLPLPNIHKDCKVCLGTASPTVPAEFLQDFIKQYERAFFSSEFNTYHGVENYYNGINLNLFWKRMSRASSFDYSVLKAYKKLTVKNILDEQV